MRDGRNTGTLSLLTRPGKKLRPLPPERSGTFPSSRPCFVSLTATLLFLVSCLVRGRRERRDYIGLHRRGYVLGHSEVSFYVESATDYYKLNYLHAYIFYCPTLEREWGRKEEWLIKECCSIEHTNSMLETELNVTPQFLKCMDVMLADLRHPSTTVLSDYHVSYCPSPKLLKERAVWK